MAEQADIQSEISGRLSETEQYARKALAGSVVGFLTGASGLLMQGSGLGKVLALGLGEGFLGSAATQALLNEEQRRSTGRWQLGRDVLGSGDRDGVEDRW